MTPPPAFIQRFPRLLAALVLVLTTLPISVLVPPGQPGGAVPAHAAGTLSINDVTLDEGDSGSVTFEFMVTLSEPAPADGVRFNIATANGTAVAGPDFVANILTGQTIPQGGTEYTFRVEVRGDSMNEPDETFVVNVTNIAGATAARAQGIGTIRNDDNRFLSISDVVQPEGQSGLTPFIFTVSLSQPAPATGVSFNIATQPGTAGANSDYVGKALLNQVIPAGGTSYSFTVDVKGDTVTEANEMFLVNVSNVIGATARDFQGMGSIMNDDDRVLRIADASRIEGDTGHGALTFSVTLSEPAPPEGVRFDIATSDGTAKSGSDYFYRALTRQWIGPASTYYSFSVSIMGDRHDEPDETFTVTLSNAVGAVIGDATATGTIVDDDGSGGGGGGGAAPVLSIAGASQLEGNGGTTPFNFNVSLSAPALAGGVSFSIATIAGSATAGADFTSRSLSSQTIPAGATSYSFAVDVLGDAAVESDETFQVAVSNIIGADAGATTATGVIKNDDAVPDVLTLSVGDAQVLEGDTGASSLTFTVTLSAPAPAGGVQFAIATADGTATSGSDYTAKSVTGLSIPVGGATHSFTVQVFGDTTPEMDETLTVKLSDVVGATVGSAGTGTIKNDDTR